MQQPTQKTFRYAHLMRLLLAAFCVGVFCAPQTLADSDSRLPFTWLGADAGYDLIWGGNPFENFSWRSSETTSAHTAASSAGPGPVTVLGAPAQSSCAPEYLCFSSAHTVCWYNLLNNGWNNTSCTPNWVFQNGYQPTVGRACTLDVYPRSVALVVVPTAGTFYQDFSVHFSVPSDATGPLDVTVRFQTHGGGTFYDRIMLELWEGNTRLWLYGAPSSNNCNPFRYSLFGNFAGKNLRLKAGGSIVTPGVEHRIESIEITSTLP
jgi:hypothetical protein